MVLSGMLLMSRKDSHSCPKNVTKSGCFRSEVVKHHPGGDVVVLLLVI